ncbi:MAG: hypothetical protein WC917_04325 [Bacilli bacterium]|jgi:hypothetical protein
MSPLPGIQIKDAETEKVEEKAVEDIKTEENDDFLDFYTALKEVVKGKKIYKLEWNDRGFYGCIVKEVLCLHKPDGKDYQWVLSEADIKGTDYMVVE